MTGLTNAFSFLVTILFDLYILVLAIRLLLQFYGASYHNPMSQFILKLSDPVVKPFRRFIPGYKGIDFAIVVLLILLELVKFSLLAFIKGVVFPSFIGLVIISFAAVIDKILDVLFYAILIRVILQLINPYLSHPIMQILYVLTEPLLSLMRKRFHLVYSGIDFSPLVLLIALKLVNILLTQPLLALGQSLGAY